MRCEEIQALLEEENQAPEVRQHLTVCSACAGHEALLSHLRQAEPRAERHPSQWAAGLPHPLWLWRKPTTYLPLVAGVVSLAYGFLELERAFPAGDELSLLARTFWEVTGLAVGEALLVASGVAARAWGLLVPVSAATIGVGGVFLLRWARSRARA